MDHIIHFILRGPTKSLVLGTEKYQFLKKDLKVRLELSISKLNMTFDAGKSPIDTTKKPVTM